MLKTSTLTLAVIATSGSLLWAYNFYQNKLSEICESEGRVLTDKEVVRRFLKGKVASGYIGHITEKDHRMVFNPVDLEKTYPNSIFEQFKSVDEYLELVPDCCLLLNSGEKSRVINFNEASGYFIPEGSSSAFNTPPRNRHARNGNGEVRRVLVSFSHAIKKKTANEEWEVVFRAAGRGQDKFVDRKNFGPRLLAPLWAGTCGESVAFI